MSIPARGWWRDDLVSRVKADPGLRWDFPDLLSGLDVLRDVVESDLTEEKNRRSTAIDTYLTEQFEEDKQVRFKQVDLLDDLLGLFVDVPMSVAPTSKRPSGKERDLAALYPIWLRLNDHPPDGPMARELAPGSGVHAGLESQFDFPAADLLLDAAFQDWSPLTVLEGAPGQGKSTITQYLCQVHRMRLLDRDVARLPGHHREAPLRLPFRVDLRDLATWFQGKDPFDPDQGPDGDHPQSVEGFLAASIGHHSGGMEFDVADLRAVLKVSACVMVFDGLDEVVDIEIRRRLVEELTATSRRLGNGSLSFQMIVTSRPAAFAKSPGFDPRVFRHLGLEAITPEIATSYSEKWIAAKQLTPRDAREVRSVLGSKLTEPHMRELARNTMQLTILLTLIYARGSSLPDKRTALYEAYIDTFLNRESEKSPIVRKHRELLINIHGHLAWILHNEAETGSGSGRIGRDDLMAVLRQYLDTEGHNPALADQLFEGVVARVVALVSRVEGSYEFEVQPLREYFAGKYLYDTAPYSPTGSEKPGGTLTDRFLALARNPYWLNVARFYAGFLSKGEIPSLVESLEDLVEDPDFSNLQQPRILANMLLADWVFNQNPRSLDAVVDLMADPLAVQVGSGGLTAIPARRRGGMEALPDGSGREELTDLCFERLEKTANVSYANGLTTLIARNGRPEEVRARWLAATSEAGGKHRERWFLHGRLLGAIESASPHELDDLLDHPPADRECMELLSGDQGAYLSADEQRAETTVDAVLSFGTPYLVSNEDTSVLNRFAQVFAHMPNLFWPIGHVRDRSGFADGGRVADSPTLARCAEVVNVWDELNVDERDWWFDSLQPWERLIGKSHDLFGDRWAHSVLAVEASGIRSAGETAADAGELFDPSVPIVRRARYARLRAGNRKWWSQQIASSGPGEDRLLALAILFSRASARTIGGVLEAAEPALQKLTAAEFQLLSACCTRATGVRFARPLRSDALDDGMRLPGELSHRPIELLAIRASRRLRESLHRKYLRDYQGRRLPLLELCVEARLGPGHNSTRAWRDALPVLRRHPVRFFFRQRGPLRDMPLTVARDICADAEVYDAELVQMAERRCSAATKFEPVAAVARREDWFPAV